MKIEEFIKRYIGKENYFYRLRGELGKEQLIVYYYGVKMFEIKDNKFTPTIKFFLPNSKNGATKEVIAKIDKIYKLTIREVLKKHQNEGFKIEHLYKAHFSSDNKTLKYYRFSY